MATYTSDADASSMAADEVISIAIIYITALFHVYYLCYYVLAILLLPLL